MSREMKNSGFDWIGEIPVQWELAPTKRVFSGKKRIVGDEADNYERLALTLNGVIKRNKDDNEGLQPEQFNGYQILEENELVFKLIDLQNIKTSRVGLSPYTGIVSPAYIILSNSETDNRFYYYWFMDMYNRCIFNRMGDDGVRSALNVKDVLEIPIPLIAESSRIKIASFLDRKCSEIDEMIALQEQIIEELKAYKQSVITEAVTKGLNPDVPMKDSGIEWIGQIPEYWEVCKIKNSLKINPPQCHKLEEDTEVSYMPMECLRNGVIEKRVALYGSLPSLTEFSDGDIVMAKVTPCFENGNIAIASDLTNGVGFGSSEVFVFRCHDNTLSNYAFYYLQSPYVKARGVSSMTGTGGLKRVNPHYFCDSVMLLPSYFEQQEIADYLDTKCTEIDNLISIKLSKIDSLKEYKKSIIYEYVTGKKEVTE